MASKPVILPETFSGDGNWEQWLLHFVDCASVNEWDDTKQLQFLRVRLTGRAQAVFHRLPQSEKDSFDEAVRALQAHFEPEGKRDLYLADFSTRSRRPVESWMEYAEELRWLAAKAYPELSTKAHEQLALTRFLSSITDAQTILLVKQKNPVSLTEAVTYTMQIESVMASTRQVPPNQEPATVPVLSTSHEDKLIDAMTKLSDKIDSMNIRQQTPRFTSKFRSPRQTSTPQSPHKPVICYRCHQEGHFARGCATPRQYRKGNDQPPAP